MNLVKELQAKLLKEEKNQPCNTSETSIKAKQTRSIEKAEKLSDKYSDIKPRQYTIKPNYLFTHPQVFSD